MRESCFVFACFYCIYNYMHLCTISKHLSIVSGHKVAWHCGQ